MRVADRGLGVELSRGIRCRRVCDPGAECIFEEVSKFGLRIQIWGDCRVAGLDIFFAGAHGASFIAFSLSGNLPMRWKNARLSWQAAEIGIDDCWIQSIAMTTAHGDNHYGRVDRKAYRNDREAHAAAGVLR